MRYKELLFGTTAAIALIELSQASFSRRIKDLKRAERTDLPEETRTETHHILPVYRGGKDSYFNAQCVTLPEHALAHLNLAEASYQQKDKDANYWAVTQIVKRMTPEEQEEFNKMISPKK